MPHVQLAFGEGAEAVGPRRWRRCLYITAPTEIAARTAIATRIGINGEELPELECVADVPAFWPPCCA
ncbi:MAG TPA: hypothetical protein VGN84_09905 [Solirubrobacterales bacterium]|nr:hypothetical protein [Solirubrobacterales bacterium]